MPAAAQSPHISSRGGNRALAAAELESSCLQISASLVVVAHDDDDDEDDEDVGNDTTMHPCSLSGRKGATLGVA